MAEIKRDPATGKYKMRAFILSPDFGHSWVMLAFGLTASRARYAVAKKIGMHFLDLRYRRCSGYDRFAARLDPGKAVVFMDNDECLSAGIPPYYGDIDEIGVDDV